jgi:aminoglycoside phosphotransferase (APT) family kinase protein
VTRPAPVDAPRLAAACARHLGQAVEVGALRRLSGGASRETWSFTVMSAGGAPQRLILRRDPGSTIGSADRSTEYRLVEAAAGAGVPVPRVRFLLDEQDDLGAGFVMDHVEGETIPRKILRDDEYAGARECLVDQAATIAAAIHRTPVDALPELAVLDAPGQVAQYRQLLDVLGEPHPTFELGLRWLERNAPEGARTAPNDARLVHGDFRNGNFIVGPEGIRSVLDWELAHLGDPVEDLGWLCVRAWRFGNDDLQAGGFGTEVQLLDAYEAASGRRVEPDHLRYWQAFGTLKWGAICLLQCSSHLSGLVRSVELAALGRRVCENEWDLLELIA